MDKSRALLLEIIELCNKYHSSFRLADLYCLLGSVTENLDISVAIIAMKLAHENDRRLTNGIESRW